MQEIISGNVPYAEYQSDMGIYRAIHAKKPPKRPKEIGVRTEIATPLWELLLRCWDHDPSARPNAVSSFRMVRFPHYRYLLATDIDATTQLEGLAV